MKTMRNCLCLSLALLAVLPGCKLRNLSPDAADVIILRNSKLQKAHAFGLLDTLYVQIAPLLKPNTAHTITLFASDGKTVISRARVKSDREGGTASIPMWFDIGMVTTGPDAGKVDPKRLTITTYEVNVKGGGTNLTLPFTVFLARGVINGVARSRLPAAPAIWSAQKNGKLSHVFFEDDDARSTNSADDEVYAGGTGFNPAKGSVDVYVTLARRWNDRDPIAAVAVAGPVAVPILQDGSLDSTKLVWNIDRLNIQEDGAFNLVADAEKDGRFDAPRDDVSPRSEWDAPGPDAVDNVGLPGFIIARNPGFPVGGTIPTIVAGHDDDADGITDEVETQLGTHPKQADTDADGLTDLQELNVQTDPLKQDSDHDGLGDKLEIESGTLPISTDSDGDGLSDGAEDTNKNGLVDAGETDGLNYDSDGSGQGDGFEVAQGQDPLLASDDASVDTDADGLTDAEEDDLGTNSTREDSDEDGLTDAEEVLLVRTDPVKADSDQDGLSDGYENEISLTDPFDANTDHGGNNDGEEVQLDLTNPLDPMDDRAGDPDGDLVKTQDELQYGTNPLASDTDSDGIEDRIELGAVFVATGEPAPFPIPVSNPGAGLVPYENPTFAHAVNPDSDNDGIPDGEEDRNQDGLVDVGAEIDPTSTNSDGDGWSDHDEVFVHGTNPATASTDGDGTPDDTDLDPLGSDTSDADGDGLTKQEELGTGSNPADADSDNDGLSDGVEVAQETNPTVSDTDGDNLNDLQETTVTHTDPLAADTDGDGISDGTEVSLVKTDPLDLDSDEDGVVDGDEDVNGNGKVDAGETDALNPDTDGGGTLDGQEYVDGTDPTLSQGPDDRTGKDANVNIASTGIFAPESGQWGYSDIFNADGGSTLSNENVSPGIKAIWNPWIMPNASLGVTVANSKQNGTIPEGFSEFSNETVRVYIIAFPLTSAGLPASDISVLYGRPLTDISGLAEEIPVQSGSKSGMGQQNIWQPPMQVGDYLVVVDLDKNGIYTSGVDLIDARRVNIHDGGFAPGFTVVNPSAHAQGEAAGQAGRGRNN